MRILELFSGTGSFTRACKRRGHDTFTIDNDPQFKPDLCADILDIDVNTIIDEYDVPQIIWASPPCQCFSAMNNHIHFDKHLNPLTKEARNSIELVKHTLDLIKELQPLYWFLENPRALLNQFPFMKKYPLRVITYCQYNDFRMKPTHLWGNFPESMIWLMCEYEDPCHEAVKYGTRGGTLSLKDSAERAKVPDLFCDMLIRSCEKDISQHWDVPINQLIRYGKKRILPGSVLQSPKSSNTVHAGVEPATTKAVYSGCRPYKTIDEYGAVPDNSRILRSIPQLSYFVNKNDGSKR